MIDSIKQIKNWPKPGVTYFDLRDFYANTEWAHGLSFNFMCGAKLMGIESRGFILATALATKHKMGLDLIRKAGKLPGPIVSKTYTLEYGQDVIEVPVSRFKREPIYIVDDVIATGQTIKAAEEACYLAGYAVLGVVSLLNIKPLNMFDPYAKSIFEATKPKDGIYEIARVM